MQEETKPLRRDISLEFGGTAGLKAEQNRKSGDMKAQEYMAEQIERMGPILAHFIATTAPDKLAWKPLTQSSTATRSIMEQVAECVGVNHSFAALLRGEGVPAGAMALPELRNAQEAETQLIDSAKALAAVIHALDDEALTRTFQTRRGSTTGKNLMIAAYRNMAYHAGQINLIQMLIGDAEFHTPPAWL